MFAQKAVPYFILSNDFTLLCVWWLWGGEYAYHYINSNSSRKLTISNRPCKSKEPAVQLLLSGSCALRSFYDHDVNLILLDTF